MREQQAEDQGGEYMIVEGWQREQYWLNVLYPKISHHESMIQEKISTESSVCFYLSRPMSAVMLS